MLVSMTNLGTRLGKVLRRHREALGMSQERLAEGAGIHRTYVSSIELGKVQVGLEVAARIAEALGTPLSSLIAEAETLSDDPRDRKGGSFDPKL